MSSSVFSPDGTLSVIKALDYEKQKLHTLEITATDLGDPPRNSTVSIVVVVTDVRDFVLSLEMDIYTANVSRSVSKGDFVIRVNASQPGAHYAISGIGITITCNLLLKQFSREFFTTQQSLSPVQIESICRRQFSMCQS